jgi:hypothetical protein
MLEHATNFSKTKKKQKKTMAYITPYYGVNTFRYYGYCKKYYGYELIVVTIVIFFLWR